MAPAAGSARAAAVGTYFFFCCGSTAHTCRSNSDMASTPDSWNRRDQGSPEDARLTGDAHQHADAQGLLVVHAERAGHIGIDHAYRLFAQVAHEVAGFLRGNLEELVDADDGLERDANLVDHVEAAVRLLLPVLVKGGAVRLIAQVEPVE